MFSETHARMNLLDNTIREPNGNYGEVLENNLEILLQEQRHAKYNDIFINKESDMNINRSGSASPSVEGSLSAIGSVLRTNQNLSIDNYYNGVDSMPSTTTTNTNSILSEQEIQSHPAYLSHYYSTENLNPRLPSPLLSREHWRMAQRLHQSFGGVADWAPRVNEETVNAFDDAVVDESSSLFSVQPILSSSAMETVDDHELMGISNSNTISNLSRVSSSTERLDRWPDGSIKLPSGDTGLGMRRRKSFADILQEGLDRSAPTPSRLSRPASHSCLSNIVDKTDTIYGPRTEDLHNDKGMSRVQSFGSLFSHSALSARATTLSRCTTPNPHIIGRTPSPRIPTAIKKVTSVEKLKHISSMNTLNRALSSSMNNLADIAASISLLSPSNNQFKHENCHMLPQHRVRFDDDSNMLLNMRNNNTLNRGLSLSMNNIADIAASTSCLSHSINQVKHEDCHVLRHQKVRFDDDSNMLLNSFTFPKGYGNVKAKAEQNVSVLGFDGKLQKSSAIHCLKTRPGFRKLEKSNISCQTHTFSHISSPVEKPSGCSVDKKQELSSYLDEGGSTLVDSRNQQSLRMQKIYDPHYIQAIASSTNSSQGSSAMLQKLHEDSYAESILPQTKNQYNPLLEKSTDFFRHPYYPNPGFGLNVGYKGNAATADSVVASGLYGDTIMPNGRNSCFNTIASRANLGDVLTSPFLEELKSNTTRPLELVEVVDNVFDFSTDQYGSRFIQQKLESATVEEKSKIFPEILSHAHALTTDVFGNYVIQKFFEHGTENQRKDLARQLVGHVLPFSLQMYGCRVIQKALEVVDVEQQTMLIAELDGSIIKCVYDQNGNHVIQKCIQCIPQDRIQFIVKSFFGQIAALSTHPYGCRVIQKVLEHCDDIKANKIIMDEIVHSACTLAQDQYGNYVVQHVLQHAKAPEQSAIIKKLAGQIVKMSKQKFASNVIEKCLTFGGPEDRQLIVKEMLGTTDKNAPLQAMTKDPFGNYVVQKVLETCDGQSCELIVSRLKHHLSALKRYTYGKHIVSRVEKLIATGEGRGGVVSSYCT